MSPQAQHMAALELANEKRLARAQLRRDVYSGKTSLASVVRRPPECLGPPKQGRDSLTVVTMVAWQRRVGLARATKLLVGLGIKTSLTLHDLSDARREQLARALEGRDTDAGPACGRCGEETREGRRYCRRCSRERAQS